MTTITGTKKKDALTGTAFADSIFGLAGNDILKGLAGNDRLDGGLGDDKLYGGAGRDTLLGGQGNDLLDGGKGDDKLLDGGAGNDTVLGGLGKDNLKGGAGDDVLEGGAGADKMDGGVGIDTASYEHSTADVGASLVGDVPALNILQFGDGLGDTLLNIEKLRGGNFNNVLTGNLNDNILDGLNGDDFLVGFLGNDTLLGGTGNDFLEGGAGADILNGGDGSDWADYELSDTGLTALLEPVTGFTNTTVATGDVYISIENLRGSNFRDLLVGDGGSNQIEGQDGNDTIDGAGGTDTLTGGAGADRFSYRFQSEGGDTITDFETAADLIVVTTPASPKFTGEFLPGHAIGVMINANELVHGTVADQAFAQFLIAANGDLSYDADGTGAGAAVLVAHLSGINAATFASGNIVVR